MENVLLENAISSYHAGNMVMARSLLEVELRRHPDGEETWLWLSRVAEEPEERVMCLERVLALNPANKVALAGLLLATQRPLPVEMPPLAARIPASVEGARPAARPRRLHGRAPGLVGLAALAAAALFFVLVAAATVPMFAGDRTLAVLSGSMEPTIHTGSAVIAQPVPSQDLQIGDVIVFSPNPQAALPLVHRIVDIRQREGVRYYTTRGDANKSGDSAEISLPQTAWRVWYAVPWAGYVISFASGDTGRLLLVLLPLSCLLLLNLADWLKRLPRLRAFLPGPRQAAAG